MVFGDIEIKKNTNFIIARTCFLEDVGNKKQKYLAWLFQAKKYEYFIAYNDDDHKIKPLHITLPKTSAYVKSYDGET